MSCCSYRQSLAGDATFSLQAHVDNSSLSLLARRSQLSSHALGLAVRCACRFQLSLNFFVVFMSLRGSYSWQCLTWLCFQLKVPLWHTRATVLCEYACAQWGGLLSKRISCRKHGKKLLSSVGAHLLNEVAFHWKKYTAVKTEGRLFLVSANVLNQFVFHWKGCIAVHTRKWTLSCI